MFSQQDVGNSPEDSASSDTPVALYFASHSTHRTLQLLSRQHGGRASSTVLHFATPRGWAPSTYFAKGETLVVTFALDQGHQKTQQVRIRILAVPLHSTNPGGRASPTDFTTLWRWRCSCHPRPTKKNPARGFYPCIVCRRHANVLTKPTGCITTRLDGKTTCELRARCKRGLEQ